MTTDPAFKEPVSHALMTQIMLQLQCHFFTLFLTLTAFTL